MWEDAIGWGLEFFRESAEELMVDEIAIDRPSVTVDPMTGKDIVTYERMYAGKAKLQSYEGYEDAKEVISHSSVIQRMSIHIPVGAYRCAVGDVVTINSSTSDPLLEGRWFRITQEAPFKTHATAYRLFVDFKAE